MVLDIHLFVFIYSFIHICIFIFVENKDQIEALGLPKYQRSHEMWWNKGVYAFILAVSLRLIVYLLHDLSLWF